MSVEHEHHEIDPWEFTTDNSGGNFVFTTNYTDLTVTVGDTITFRWDGTHNVVKMTSDDCDLVRNDDFEILGTTSPYTYTVTMDDLQNNNNNNNGTFALACSVLNGLHCDWGMVFAVHVQPELFNPSQGPSESPTLSPQPSASDMPSMSPSSSGEPTRSSPPSSRPSILPSQLPSESSEPTYLDSGTRSPTTSPSQWPTLSRIPTPQPTPRPTRSPITQPPIANPITVRQTVEDIRATLRGMDQPLDDEGQQAYAEELDKMTVQYFGGGGGRGRFLLLEAQKQEQQQQRLAELLLRRHLATGQVANVQSETMITDQEVDVGSGLVLTYAQTITFDVEDGSDITAADVLMEPFLTDDSRVDELLDNLQNHPTGAFDTLTGLSDPAVPPTPLAPTTAPGTAAPTTGAPSAATRASDKSLFFLLGTNTLVWTTSLVLWVVLLLQQQT